MFYSSKLKPGNDPVNFVDYMESVRTEMDEIHQDTDGVVIGATLMSDRQFVQTILNALTDDYANLIEKVEDKIDEGTPLGIEDLKEKLAAKYTRIKVWSKQENKNESHEHALDGTDSTPSYYTDGFSGLCRNCGKRGHKSVNGPDKNNSNGNKVGNFGPPRLKGKCYNCGKIGHRKMECRAPKQTNERANTAVNGRNNGCRKQDQDDMVLMAVDVDDYDFCPMAIDSVTTQDSHEIEDLFFDRFTYESDNDYDDSYDSTPFEDKEYDIVSMFTDLC
jgi:regulator of replication initiation timing